MSGPREKLRSTRTLNKTSVRRPLSYATYAGVVPPPGVFRPFGISAMTMAKNEEDWIETSVKSILKFVDEVVVADNGSEDHTAEIIARLGRAFPEKIRVVKLIDEDFVPAVNSVMLQTKYRWILRWHADFVAHT